MTREEAKALGLKYYCTEQPCRRGHVANRLVSTRSCTECQKINCRRHYDAHLPRIKERTRQYQLAHRDECKDWAHRSYVAHREELKIKHRLYWAAPSHRENAKINLRKLRESDDAAGWYIYFLRHPITKIVFWVGSSKRRKRHRAHLSEARTRSLREKRCGNVHKDALIRYLLVLGMEPIFEKVIEGLDTKEEALDLENLIIRRIGTLELGTGPLVNVEGTGRRRKRRKRAIDVMFEMKDCAA